MKSASEPLPPWAAAYTPLSLRFYNFFVLGLSNRFLWRCETRELLALYQRNVSANHLDVGVGTGLLLDQTQFPSEHPSITLMDMNPACLEAASQRIARHAPKLVQGDVLKPLPPVGPFSSIGLCYLLHCLPGDIPAKAGALDNLKAVMVPSSRIFGATFVQGSAPRSAITQRFLDFYNFKGYMSNSHDTIEDLRVELEARFQDVRITMRGCAALFEATRA
jgi:ubiquinone/menaquinone biosynthesis C-methylase UbiE